MKPAGRQALPLVGEAIDGGEGRWVREGPRRLPGSSRGNHSDAGEEGGGGDLCAGRGRVWLGAGTSALRGTATQEPSRGPGVTAMDIPPLAGKIAVLSLGALPLSFALNSVSVLS